MTRWTAYDLTTPEAAAEVLCAVYHGDAAVAALSWIMRARADGDAMDWLFWSRVTRILHPYTGDLPIKR